jgi:HK97 family phage portal protein
MGLIGNLRESIAKMFGTNSRTMYNAFNDAFMEIGGGYAPYDVSMKTYLEEGYNTNAMVFSVINAMANKSSTVPIYVREIKNEEAYDGLKKLRNATGYDMALTQKLKHLSLESKAFADQVAPLPLKKPNPYQTWTELGQLYKTFIRMTGNAYFLIESADDGMNKDEPKALYILPSHLMKIVVKDGVSMVGMENPVKEYMLIEGNQSITFPSEKVIHVKYGNPNYSEDGEHLYGFSPLRPLLKNIQSSNDAMELNAKTLKSGGAFGFIHGKNVPITEEQAQQLKQRLIEMNNDPGDLARIAGSSAEMGFTRISLTADELKPFDYLKFDMKQICNALGWSDNLMNNDDGGKHDKQQEERKRVVTDNIVPDLKLLIEALNDEFLPRFKKYKNYCLEFDIMELPEMQDDAKELSEIMFEGVRMAVFNRNEARKALNWPEKEDEAMERHTLSSDVISLDEAIDNDFNGNQGNHGFEQEERPTGDSERMDSVNGD